MKTLLNNRNVLLLLFVLAMTSGYFAFRLLYRVSDDFPFSQELLLVFLGAIATILITALLLNQQTELELRKEGQVLLLDQKSATYMALIEHIGAIVEKGQMDAAQLAELRVLNHKLAMIGSADVIARFRDVLKRLDQAVADARIADKEQAEIMQAVAVLTYHMRRDLLGRIEGEDGKTVLANIIANSTDLED
ncbi:MAG TPA: hypothetical protein ENJ91_08440 [Rhodobacteraceae bacterium]|nr:hypothetical protein [Paracoccaceae bacterium]